MTTKTCHPRAVAAATASRARDPLPALAARDVAVVDVQHAVAVEEQRRPVQPRRHLGLCAREVVRDADVDEPAVCERRPSAAVGERDVPAETGQQGSADRPRPGRRAGLAEQRPAGRVRRVGAGVADQRAEAAVEQTRAVQQQEALVRRGFIKAVREREGGGAGQGGGGFPQPVPAAGVLGQDEEAIDAEALQLAHQPPRERLAADGGGRLRAGEDRRLGQHAVWRLSARRRAGWRSRWRTACRRRR